MDRSQSNRRRRLQRGFTLIEAVLSMSITALVLGALTSVLLLAGRAMPGRSGPGESAVEAAMALAQLRSDLNEAIHLVEFTPTRISFTLGDRTGDGQVEVVTYEWSGRPGQPLTRQLNRGAAEVLIESVYDWSMHSDVEAVEETYAGPAVLSSVQELAEVINATDSEVKELDDGHWWGQRILPALSSDAIGWRLTRMKFFVRQSDQPTGALSVKVHDVDSSGLPTGDPLASVSLSEASLPVSGGWIELNFADLPMRAADEPLAVVFTTQDMERAADLLIAKLDAPIGGAALLECGSMGDDWNEDDVRALFHIAEGIVASEGTPRTYIKHFIRRLDISLTAGDPAYAPIATSIGLANRPQVLDAYAELDFEQDPTSVDVNGDAVVDWQAMSGTLSTDSLSDGRWYGGVNLIGTPAGRYNGVTELGLRFRSLRPDGLSTAALVTADWSGSLAATLIVTVKMQDDGSQTLTLSSAINSSETLVLKTVEGLSDALIDVNMLIDAAADAVSLRVNGVSMGSWSYERYSASGAYPGVILLGQLDHCEYDWVRLRAGPIDLDSANGGKGMP